MNSKERRQLHRGKASANTQASSQLIDLYELNQQEPIILPTIMDEQTYYGYLKIEQEILTTEENNQRLTIEQEHFERANLLSLNQIQLTQKIKHYMSLKIHENQLMNQLHNLTQECLSVSTLSIDDINTQIDCLTTALSEQKEKNNQLTLLIKTTKKEINKHVSDHVLVREKDLITEKTQEEYNVNIALKAIKKQLTDEQSLATELILEESTLQEQLSAAYAEEIKTESLLTSATRLHNNMYALHDQCLFLEMDRELVVRCLYFTNNTTFRLALHWRLGFIEHKNEHVYRSINHLNTALQGDPTQYQTAKTFLIEFKNALLHNNLGLPPKKRIEIAQQAYEKNRHDEAIMYATSVIDTVKKHDFLRACNLLIQIYLQQDDWVHVDGLYHKLCLYQQQAHKSLSHLIEHEIKTAVESVKRRVLSYLVSEDHSSMFHALKATTSEIFRAYITDSEMGEQLKPLTQKSIEYCLALQQDPRSSPIHMGIISLTLLDLFDHKMQFDHVKTQLIWINQQPSIPTLIKAWAYFLCAEQFHKKDQDLLAKQHYQTALTYLPSFTEARNALHALTNTIDPKTLAHNKHLFFQPETISFQETSPLFTTALSDYDN